MTLDTADVTLPATNSKCAGQIMTLYPVTVYLSDPVERVAQILTSRNISGVPVVDRHDRLMGVVSKSDLLRRCALGDSEDGPAYLMDVVRGVRPPNKDALQLPPICVHDVMTPNPAKVCPDSPLVEVARLMVSRRVHRVIVVDENGFPIGIITSLDLINALVS